MEMVISVGGLLPEDLALFQCCDSFIAQLSNTKQKNSQIEWENQFNISRIG